MLLRNDQLSQRQSSSHQKLAFYPSNSVLPSFGIDNVPFNVLTEAKNTSWRGTHLGTAQQAADKLKQTSITQSCSSHSPGFLFQGVHFFSGQSKIAQLEARFLAQDRARNWKLEFLSSQTGGASDVCLWACSIHELFQLTVDPVRNQISWLVGNRHRNSDTCF